MKTIRVDAKIFPPDVGFEKAHPIFSFRGDVAFELGTRTLDQVFNEKKFLVKQVPCDIKRFDVPSKTLFLTATMESTSKGCIHNLLRYGWIMDVGNASYYEMWIPHNLRPHSYASPHQ